MAWNLQSLKIAAGLDIHDTNALNGTQQEKLHWLKENTEVDNELYLRDHPEIDCMVELFLEEVFVKKPENTYEFSAEFFTRRSLRQDVQTMLASQYKTGASRKKVIEGKAQAATPVERSESSYDEQSLLWFETEEWLPEDAFDEFEETNEDEGIEDDTFALTESVTYVSSDAASDIN